MLKRLVCVAMLTAGAASAAAAQDREADLRARQEQIYAAMLAAPDDLDLMFEHALTSIELRDFEAAINTLERMLIYNPNLSRAKVELGAAYFRLGAYENARYYFDDVLANDGPPPEVARRIHVFLDEIDKRTQISGFSGVASFGVVYSSNANLGPSNSNIVVLGVQGTLNDEFVEADDIGFRASLQGQHYYDLGRPNDDVWLTDVSLFSLHYVSETSGDLDNIAIYTGPRLGLDDKRFGPKIRPFLSLEALRSDNDLLYYGVGLGAEYTDTLTETVNVFGAVESKWREYDERNDFDGSSHRIGAGASYSPDADTSFSALTYFETDQAAKNYNTNYETGLRLAAVHRYDSGLDFTDRLWSISGFAGATYRWYDDADPIVDPNRKRHDVDLQAGIANTFHLTGGWFVQAEADYLYRNSNLKNFDLKNFGAALSVGLTF